jgi:hypothetical protein
MLTPTVKSVTAVKEYLLHVVFIDGTQGDYDMSHLAGKGVFKSWDTDNNFYKVSINPESGAITWPGDLDIDTINAYCKIKGIDVDAYLSTEKPAAY